MITTVLAFLLTLGVLIVIHEYGHYRVAVACGVKVLRFSVGFGRVVWRRQATPEATEFVLCALPLGGYVRMLDEREARRGAGRAGAGLQPPAAAAAHRHRRRRARWPTWCWRCCCTPLRTGSASTSPRPCSARPRRRSLAERAGLRAGDWVRALSHDGSRVAGRASMTDLRWEVTQAAMQREPLQLQVSGRDGRGSRTLVLDLRAIDPREVDAGLMKRSAWARPTASRCWARSRPAARPRRPGCARATACWRIDGTAGGRRADAARAHPRRRARRPAAGAALVAGTRRPRAGDRGHAARGRATAPPPSAASTPSSASRPRW